MLVRCKTCRAAVDLPPGTEPGTRTWCGCCTVPHDHGRAAEACPGNNGAGHPGQRCPHPDPASCTLLTPQGAPCPGGHCGRGVPGCTVCRPVEHLPVAGSPA